MRRGREDEKVGIEDDEEKKGPIFVRRDPSGSGVTSLKSGWIKTG